MIKREELADPESCLNRSHDDEPLFVLRASDALAADTVRSWVAWSRLWKMHSIATIRGAERLADRMDEWRRRKHSFEEHRPASTPIDAEFAPSTSESPRRLTIYSAKQRHAAPFISLSSEEAYELIALLTFALEHRSLDEHPVSVSGVFLAVDRTGK